MPRHGEILSRKPGAVVLTDGDTTSPSATSGIVTRALVASAGGAGAGDGGSAVFAPTPSRKTRVNPSLRAATLGVSYATRDGKPPAMNATPALSEGAPVLIARAPLPRMSALLSPGTFDEGIPAELYAEAAEASFLGPDKEGGSDYATLIRILNQGQTIRRAMADVVTVKTTSQETAVACLSNLIEIRMALSGLGTSPKDEKEIRFLTDAGNELRALQHALATRAMNTKLKTSPSLLYALTYLCLGAVSIDLVELRKHVPISGLAGSTESKHSAGSAASSATPPGFTVANPMLATARPKPTGAIEATATSGDRTIGLLVAAADDYLRHHFPDDYAGMSGHFPPGWVDLALASLQDKWSPDSNPFVLIFKKNAIYRTTRQEPIVFDCCKMGALAAVATGITLFMTYKVGNPYAEENIHAAPGSVFGEASPSRTAKATASPTALASMADAIQSAITSALATLSPDATGTPSKSLSVTVTRSASGSISASVTARPTESGSSSYTATITVSRTASGSPSVSFSPSPFNCNFAGLDASLKRLVYPPMIDSSYGTYSTIAPDGSILVAGLAGAGGDIYITKLSSAGAHLWTKLIDGHHYDLIGIKITADGRYLLFGTGYFSGFELDIYLMKGRLDDGTVESVKALMMARVDILYGLTQAPDGSFYGALALADATLSGLMKLDPEGNFLWARQYNLGYISQATSISFADGNLVIVGFHKETSDSPYNGYVLKANPVDGHVIDAKRLGTGYSVSTYRMTTAADGSIFIARQITRSSGDLDILVTKLNPSLNHLWSTLLGSNTMDGAYGLATNDANNLLLLGETIGKPFIASIDSGDGSLGTASVLNFSGMGHQSININGSSLIVTGHGLFNLSSGRRDAFMARFGSDGRWPFPSSLMAPAPFVQTPFFLNMTNISSFTDTSLVVTPQDVMSHFNTSSLNMTTEEHKCDGAIAPSPTSSPRPSSRRLLEDAPYSGLFSRSSSTHNPYLRLTMPRVLPPGGWSAATDSSSSLVSSFSQTAVAAGLGFTALISLLGLLMCCTRRCAASRPKKSGGFGLFETRTSSADPASPGAEYKAGLV